MAERFDKEAVYDTEIYPLMGQIIEICQREQIPMAASFHLRDEDEDAEEPDSLECTTANTTYENTPQQLKDAVKAIYRPDSQAFAITVTKSHP